MGKAGFQFDSGVLRRSLLDGDWQGAVHDQPTRHYDGCGLASPSQRPVDRMLIGQAASEGFILVTKNHAIAKYSGPIKHVGWMRQPSIPCR